MKINPIAGQQALSAYKTQKTKSTSEGFLQSPDQVTLSDEVISFSSTISKIKEQLDVRSPEELAHIEEITRLIRGGSYQVDSPKVAAKIVEDFLGLDK